MIGLLSYQKNIPEDESETFQILEFADEPDNHSIVAEILFVTGIEDWKSHRKCTIRAVVLDIVEAVGETCEGRTHIIFVVQNSLAIGFQFVVVTVGGPMHRPRRFEMQLLFLSYFHWCLRLLNVLRLFAWIPVHFNHFAWLAPMTDKFPQSLPIIFEVIEDAVNTWHDIVDTEIFHPHFLLGSKKLSIAQEFEYRSINELPVDHVGNRLSYVERHARIAHFLHLILAEVELPSRLQQFFLEEFGDLA